jgi:hypothetical protein
MSIVDELREYAIGQPQGLHSLLTRAVAEIESLNVILAHYEETAVMPDEIDRIEAAAVAADRADPNKERDDACDRIEAARRAESSADQAGENHD